MCSRRRSTCAKSCFERREMRRRARSTMGCSICWSPRDVARGKGLTARAGPPRSSCVRTKTAGREPIGAARTPGRPPGPGGVGGRGARLVVRPPPPGAALAPAPAVLLAPAALLRAPLVFRLEVVRFRAAVLPDPAARDVFLREPAAARRALFRAVLLRAVLLRAVFFAAPRALLLRPPFRAAPRPPRELSAASEGSVFAVC